MERVLQCGIALREDDGTIIFWACNGSDLAIHLRIINSSECFENIVIRMKQIDELWFVIKGRYSGESDYLFL